MASAVGGSFAAGAKHTIAKKRRTTTAAAAVLLAILAGPGTPATAQEGVSLSKLMALRDAGGESGTQGSLYSQWYSVGDPFDEPRWASAPIVYPTFPSPGLDALAVRTRKVIAHMCFGRGFCGRDGERDGSWEPFWLTGNADLNTGYNGRYDRSQQRVYLTANGATKDDLIAHELGHLMDFAYAHNRLVDQDRQGKEVQEALADMFAYDYDYGDATLGEDDGSASIDWANPSSITSPTEDAPFPAVMRDYKCSATDPHFNATILGHAYWRFVQKVGRAKAGRVLQYISWFVGSRPRFIEVYRGFVQRSQELYPGPGGTQSSVGVAARKAFRDEVGIGRDEPAGDGC